MSQAKSVSAAHIVVRPRAQVPDVAAERRLKGLRELLDTCGTNRHDRAIALITACIGDGVNTRSDIVSLGKKLDLNGSHIAIILNEGTGSDPIRHHWRRDDNGVYSLLE